MTIISAILTSTLLSSNEMDADLCTMDRSIGLLEKVLKVKFDLQQVILNNREFRKRNLYDKCYDMEVQANDMNQYLRRSNTGKYPPTLPGKTLNRHSSLNRDRCGLVRYCSGTSFGKVCGW